MKPADSGSLAGAFWCQAPGQTNDNVQLMDSVSPQTSFLATISYEKPGFSWNPYG